MRPHRSLCEAFKKCCVDRKAYACLERAIPDLYREGDTPGSVDEAILDVVVRVPAFSHQWCGDITVRSPHAQRYNLAHEIPGQACEEGESQKRERYGSIVAPIAFETYGRLGAQSQHALHHLATEIILHEGEEEYGRTVRKFYAEIRLALERTLLIEEADSTLLCLGHSSGVHSFKLKQRRGKRISAPNTRAPKRRALTQPSQATTATTTSTPPPPQPPLLREGSTRLDRRRKQRHSR